MIESRAAIILLVIRKFVTMSNSSSVLVTLLLAKQFQLRQFYSIILLPINTKLITDLGIEKRRRQTVKTSP